MGPQLTPVNRALILVNVALFGVQWLIGPALLEPFALWPPGALDRLSGAWPFQPWQLLTYGFLHGGFMHLFFNMFAMYMFGSELEELFGRKRYLIYYLACVIGAALMHLIVVDAASLPPFPTVGASGGVFGLLLAYGMTWPKRTLMLLFPPIPMPAWLFVTLYGALELYLGVTGTISGVAHFAHLGGMATGFVIIRYWRGQRRPRTGWR